MSITPAAEILTLSHLACVDLFCADPTSPRYVTDAEIQDFLRYKCQEGLPARLALAKALGVDPLKLRRVGRTRPPIKSIFLDKEPGW